MTNNVMIGAIELCKSFGEVRAVNNVSLEVGAGSILGVLGPNGAGKTTAVRILTTLTRPDSGRAWVAGHDVVREATAVRGRIGVTGQDATLDESLTGRQNLTMVGELSRLKRSAARVRATELLEQFELSDAADRPVKTYSGGMRRRLDLAASLVARPPVLFLDEPTTGLDPTSRQRMWTLIRGLVAEGVTVLLTTQYLDEADALANRIAVVDHGRLIAEGTPAELKASTGSQFLEVKLASPHPGAMEALKDLSIGSISVSESGRRLLVPARSQVGLAVAALRTLDEAGALVEDIAVHQPSLDDVFAVLTGTHDIMALQEVPA
jgi:ABC-2 type transport system ATP-binding protein